MDVARRLRDAQSDQLRVRRWLSNPRIDVTTVDDAVVGEALSRRGQQRVYLSLEPTLVWNCFWIVWVGVVDRGGTLDLA